MQGLSARIGVMAILRSGAETLEHPPRRATRFAPGDRAFLIGPYEELPPSPPISGRPKHHRQGTCGGTGLGVAVPMAV